MKIVQTSIPGLLIIEPAVYGDERGFFLESWNQKALEEAGVFYRFVQDNHSKSVKGVLRGLHYQLNNEQAKLVRVVSGEVFDVAVDVRKGSPSFGHWVSVCLSADNKRQLLIPEGFAHGFLVLSDEAEFLYKCSEYYSPCDEKTIAYNDPQLGISWPSVDYELILSNKDLAGKNVADMDDSEFPVFQGDTV